MADNFDKKLWNEFWVTIQKVNDTFLDAIELGKIEQVIELLDPLKNAYPINVNMTSLNDFTPLHIATQNNHSKII